MLIILSGSSGAGKNTIMHDLINRLDNVEMFSSYTTRNMRDGESQGNPYIFVSYDEFMRRVQNDEFYEWERVHGDTCYGIHKAELQEKLARNIIAIKDIDVKGTLNLVKKLKDETKIITVFLTVEKEILRERLIERGEKDIDLRLSRYDMEQEYKKDYDYVIENINEEETVQKIINIIENEK